MTIKRATQEEIRERRNEEKMQIIHPPSKITSNLVMSIDLDFPESIIRDSRNKGLSESQLSYSKVSDLQNEIDIFKYEVFQLAMFESRHINELQEKIEVSDERKRPIESQANSIKPLILITSHRPQYTSSIAKVPHRVKYFSTPLTAKPSVGSMGPSFQAIQMSILLCLILLAASPTLRAGFCAPMMRSNINDDSMNRGIKTSTTVERPQSKPMAISTNDLSKSQIEHASKKDTAPAISSFELKTSAPDRLDVVYNGSPNRERSEINHGPVRDNNHDADDDETLIRILDDQSSSHPLTNVGSDLSKTSGGSHDK